MKKNSDFAVEPMDKISLLYFLLQIGFIRNLSLFTEDTVKWDELLSPNVTAV